MSITNLEIKKFPQAKGNMLGTGEVTVANAIKVKFTVIKGKRGVFASLPSHKGKNKDTGEDQYFTDVRFCQDDDYEKFQQEIKKAFSSQDSAGEHNQTEGMPF